MQQILQAINNSGFTPIEGQELNFAAQSVVNLSAINPSDLKIDLQEGVVANIIMLHGDASNISILINLGCNAQLNLTQISVGTGLVDLSVNHSEGAKSKIVGVSLRSNANTLHLQLCGADAFSEVDTLQLGVEKDKNSLRIDMRHMSPDCSSRSLSKCVASGESTLQFDGLVYVAHDAQRTAAEQNCRCIELSNSSHIVSQPQLEIYADDVKCSHGATMGQINTDAIFYLRQRGLSEAQARRVQIEGFITDVVNKCNISQICEALQAIVSEKLEEM